MADSSDGCDVHDELGGGIKEVNQMITRVRLN